MEGQPMPALLPIILVSTQIILAAEQVPEFDMSPTCRGAVIAAGNSNRDESACKKDEQAAHDTLQQHWSQFSLDQKSNCVRLSTLGGDPSYVELLTCLELDQRVNDLRAGGKLSVGVPKKP
jgi:hypothetical protein